MILGLTVKRDSRDAIGKGFGSEVACAIDAA